MCTPAHTPRAKPKAPTKPFVYLLTQFSTDDDYGDWELYHIYVGDIWVSQTHSLTEARYAADDIARVNKTTLIKGRLK